MTRFILILSFFSILDFVGNPNAVFAQNTQVAQQRELMVDTIAFEDMNYSYTIVKFYDKQSTYQINVDRHDSRVKLDFLLWNSSGEGKLDAIIYYDQEQAKYITKSLVAPIDFEGITEFQIQIEEVWFPSYYNSKGAIAIALTEEKSRKFDPVRGEERLLFGEAEMAGVTDLLSPYGSLRITYDNGMVSWEVDTTGDGLADQEYIDEDGDGSWDSESYAILEEDLAEQSFLEELEKMMIPIKGGSFKMGCNSGFQDGCDYQDPTIRQVTLDDFHMLDREVSQRMWTEIMGTDLEDPMYSLGFKNQFSGSESGSESESNSNLALEHVTYKIALKYIDELNNRTGKVYRLPTEAEWEYAASAKSTSDEYSGSGTLANVGWSYQNAEYKVHEGMQLEANAFGLYDMSGNVMEWCSDWYAPYAAQMENLDNPKGPNSGIYKILRGGGYHVKDEALFRVYTRNYVMPVRGGEGMGFRIVN